MNFKKLIQTFLFLLVISNLVVWFEIFSSQKIENTQLYFFNVGQGDSEMIILPDNIKILIDGGPDNSLLKEIPKALSLSDRYIDFVVMTHPQQDHFGGLIEIAKRYQVGAFIYSGKDTNSKGFAEFKKILNERNIKIITLEQNDKIKYQASVINILSPNLADIKNKDINKSTIVLYLKNNDTSALYTGDIDKKIEQKIISEYNFKADVLKVSHHGSKHSSSQEFINIISPKVAVIEVGKNSYGHPTAEVLDRLKTFGVKIFRTDQNGTIKILANAGNLNIFQTK